MDSKKKLRRDNKKTKLVKRVEKVEAEVEELKINRYDEIEVDGKMVKTEPSNWLLIKNGVVDNIIFGHPGYNETIRDQYDFIMGQEGVDGEVSIGWLYDRATNSFSHPNPAPEKVHEFVDPDDAERTGDLGNFDHLYDKDGKLKGGK